MASEIYLHGLPYAARRVSPPVEFIQADCLALPYDREFDAVGAFDVIEHIDREADAIAEMRRALAARRRDFPYRSAASMVMEPG